MFSVLMQPVLLLTFWFSSALCDVIGDRHEVYWNRSNPSFSEGELTVEVSINDYLLIFCPHYEEPRPADRLEQYVLFMVTYHGFVSCDHRRTGFKRWECARPLGPDGPVRFSEKFQLFTPFSLGFEFRPGNEYYYISSPLTTAGRACLKLRVYVRPSNDSVYDSVESFLTEDSAEGGVSPLRRPFLFLGLSLTLFLAFL